MSLFFLTVKTISKSKQSAIASAAYRSGEALYSERDKEIKFYGERTVKPESFILAPDHAPEWVKDRQRLWNEVESVEKNWNARLAREVLVALPRELSDNAQKELIKEFAKENFVSQGMVADISIHRDKEQNPHAHIMLTVRPFDENGVWANKKKKEYLIDEDGNNILDDNRKKKYKTIQLTNWDRKETLLEWRKNFAEKINDYYQKYNIAESVSDKSYEEQGLNKIPKQRLTLQEYAIEKRELRKSIALGEDYQPKTHYGQLNQEIKQVNKEIETLDKEIKKSNLLLDSFRKKQVKDLNQIRKLKSQHLSKDEVTSLKIVSKRVGGFIDYKIAIDNINKVNNWGKKLEFQKSLLETEEKILKKVRVYFKDQPEKLKHYGFGVENFTEEYNRKVNEFNTKNQQHDKSMQAYEILLNHSKKVYEIHKKLLTDEFNHIYPQYIDKLEDNDKVMKVKYRYVQAYRQDCYHQEDIKEFSNEIEQLKISNIELGKFVKEWDEVNKSLIILKRQQEKIKSKYNQSFNKLNPEERYKLVLALSNCNEQIRKNEKRKKELSDFFNRHIKMKYPDGYKSINNNPMEIQVGLLNLHLKNKNTGSLSKDLRILERMNNNHTEHKEFEKPSGESKEEVTGILIGALLNYDMQQSNYDLPQIKKDKSKPKKILQKELDREK